MERRFRHCMEEMDNALGADLANTAFTNCAAFHGLFSAVYGAAFEIGSSLKKEKARTLPADFKARVLKASDAIRTGKAPDKVMEALARRTTHKDSRKTVVDYLTKNPAFSCLDPRLPSRMTSRLVCEGSSAPERSSNDYSLAGTSRATMSVCSTKAYF